MTPDSPRRPNLLDLLVLIAGCAGGLALGRYYIGSGAHLHYHWGSERYAVIEGWGTSLGLALTMTTLVLKVRRPRPSWRELGRQPGFIACLIVAASVAVRIPEVVLIYGRGGFSSSFFRQALFANVLGAQGYGFPVLVGWGTLKLSGGWTPEVGAIDRLGRVLGWGWIAVFAVLPLVHWHASS